MYRVSSRKPKVAVMLLSSLSTAGVVVLVLFDVLCTLWIWDMGYGYVYVHFMHWKNCSTWLHLCIYATYACRLLFYLRMSFFYSSIFFREFSSMCVHLYIKFSFTLRNIKPKSNKKKTTQTFYSLRLYFAMNRSDDMLLSQSTDEMENM